MTQTKAILWDMDGTLIDTTELHELTWKEILLEKGIHYDEKLFYEKYGLNNEAFVPFFIPGISQEDIQKIADEKETRFRINISRGVRLTPGAGKWLERFASLGFSQAIASSAPLANIHALIDTAGIGGYFHAIASGEYLPGKPNPDIFLAAANALNIPPKNCVVIEDSPFGVQGAHRAGMKVLALLTSRTAEKLGEADQIIENLDHLTLPLFMQFLKSTQKVN